MSGKPNKYAGTKTEKNLEAAFAGESQARNKYTYFAQIAEKEGMEQIAELFLKSAENEKVHAKMWLRELGGINGTLENLSDAADGENHEWTDMYETFAREAEADVSSAGCWPENTPRGLRHSTREPVFYHKPFYPTVMPDVASHKRNPLLNGD